MIALPRTLKSFPPLKESRSKFRNWQSVRSSLILLTAIVIQPNLSGEEVPASSVSYNVTHRVLDLGGGRTSTSRHNLDTSLGGFGGVARTDSGRVTIEMGRPGFLTQDDRLNYAPLANPNLILRHPGLSVKVKASALLADDLDPEGGPLSVLAVSPISESGGSVTLEGEWIFYVPPDGFQAADSFTYTISDEQGGMATGIVTVNLGPLSSDLTLNLVAIEDVPASTSKRLRFAGIPGQLYLVQVTPSLNDPVWTTLGQVIAASDGTYEIIDEDAGSSPIRFYRAIWP